MICPVHIFGTLKFSSFDILIHNLVKNSVIVHYVLEKIVRLLEFDVPSAHF